MTSTTIRDMRKEFMDISTNRKPYSRFHQRSFTFVVLRPVIQRRLVTGNYAARAYSLRLLRSRSPFLNNKDR